MASKAEDRLKAETEPGAGPEGVLAVGRLICEVGADGAVIIRATKDPSLPRRRALQTIALLGVGLAGIYLTATLPEETMLQTWAAFPLVLIAGVISPLMLLTIHGYAEDLAARRSIVRPRLRRSLELRQPADAYREGFPATETTLDGEPFAAGRLQKVLVAMRSRGARSWVMELHLLFEHGAVELDTFPFLDLTDSRLWQFATGLARDLNCEVAEGRTETLAGPTRAVLAVGMLLILLAWVLLFINAGHATPVIWGFAVAACIVPNLIVATWGAKRALRDREEWVGW